MTDHDLLDPLALTELLERSADHVVVGPAPIADILTSGRGRWRAPIIAAASIVILVVGVTFAFFDTHHGPGHEDRVPPGTHRDLGRTSRVAVTGPWTIDQYYAPDGSALLTASVDDGIVVTLTFADGAVSASSTCTRDRQFGGMVGPERDPHVGRFTQDGADGSDVTISGFSVVNRDLRCPFASVTHNLRFSYLNAVRHATGVGGQLLLQSATWSVVAVLDPAPVSANVIPKTRVVPDLVGHHLSSPIANELGSTLSIKVVYDRKSRLTSNVILMQSPAAGTRLLPGQSITVTISNRHPHWGPARGGPMPKGSKTARAR